MGAQGRRTGPRGGGGGGPKVANVRSRAECRLNFMLSYMLLTGGGPGNPPPPNKKPGYATVARVMSVIIMEQYAGYIRPVNHHFHRLNSARILYGFSM